jgi:serine/threonine-protein kinase RsbW
VEAFLLEIHDLVGFEEDILDRIMISVTEVVNNSIIHGNGSDPDKTVMLECRCFDDHVEFTIRDQGGGFRPDEVPDPLDERNLLKEGGRGVLIVRAMMDEVEFTQTDSGMEVRLAVKRRAD